MSLRRWKETFSKATKSVTEGVSGVVDKASNILDTELTLESAQKELVDDLEKGLRIFDEIGLPQEKGDKLQEEIADYAMLILKENFPVVKVSSLKRDGND